MNQTTLIFFVQSALIYLIIFGVHALRNKITRAPFYILLGAMTWIMWWITDAGLRVEIMGLSLLVGSTVYYSAILVGIFLVFLFDGTTATKRSIVIVIAVSVIVPVTSLIIHYHAVLDPTSILAHVPIPDFRINTASILATVADLILLVVLWDLLSRIKSSLPLWARIFITLLAVMWLDVLLFGAGAFLGTEIFWINLKGTGITRFWTLITIFPFLWLYVSWQKKLISHDLDDLQTTDVLSEIADVKRELGSTKESLEEHKLIAQRLKESEERLAEFINSAENSYHILDASLNILEINKPALDAIIAGNPKITSKQDVLGKNFEDFYPFLKLELPQFMNVLETGEIYKNSISVPHPALGEMHVEFACFKVGKDLGIIAENVTERVQADKALQESHNDFKMVIEQSPSVIEIYNMDGLQIAVNKAYEVLWGFDGSETVNKFNILKSKRVVETGMIAYVKRAYAGQTVTLPESEFHPSDPSETKQKPAVRWLSTKIYPLKDVDGNVNNIVVTHEDITNRKNAEDRLIESEYLLRESQKVAGIGSYVFDATTGTWDSSPGLDELFGIGREYPKDIEGWTNIVHEDHREMIKTYLETEVLTDLQEFSKEYKIKRISDGHVRWVLGLGILEIDENSNPLKMMGTIQDITDRKNAEETNLNFEKQILQTQKLESLGVLAGGIAHDFNNILMGILGYADLALSEMDALSPAREYVRGINDSSKKAADLVKQMLAYSGKGKFTLEPIDLNQLIEDTVQMFTISISKSVVIKYNYSSEKVFMQGDPSQIRQIVMNLVINASEAVGEQSGAISITTGRKYCDREYIESTGFETKTTRDSLPEGNYAFVEVSDSGSGMDDEIIDRIFEPFFTTKFTGRGLGLSAVLGIVRGHTGMVSIYSEIGKGTTFKILFPDFEPAVDQMDSDKSEKPVTEEWKGEGTFLIADDESAVRSVGKRMLERLGFKVLTAVDGQEAIEIFQAHSDNLAGVLLDLTMPNRNGAEVFREIRQINPDIRVILTSGYNEKDATQQFVGKGLAGFIQKPFVSSDLIKKIVEIFGS